MGIPQNRSDLQQLSHGCLIESDLHVLIFSPGYDFLAPELSTDFPCKRFLELSNCARRY